MRPKSKEDFALHRSAHSGARHVDVARLAVDRCHAVPPLVGVGWKPIAVNGITAKSLCVDPLQAGRFPRWAPTWDCAREGWESHAGLTLTEKLLAARDPHRGLLGLAEEGHPVASIAMPGPLLGRRETQKDRGRRLSDAPEGPVKTSGQQSSRVTAASSAALMRTRSAKPCTRQSTGGRCAVAHYFRSARRSVCTPWGLCNRRSSRRLPKQPTLNSTDNSGVDPFTSFVSRSASDAQRIHATSAASPRTA